MKPIFTSICLLLILAIYAQDTIKPHIKFVHYIGITGGTEYHPLKTNNAVTSRDSTLNPIHWAYSKSAKMKDLPNYINGGWGIGINYEAGLVNKKNTLQPALQVGCAYGSPGTYYWMLSPHRLANSHGTYVYPDHFFISTFYYLKFNLRYSFSIFFAKNFNAGIFFEVSNNEYIKSRSTTQYFISGKQDQVNSGNLVSKSTTGEYYAMTKETFAKDLSYNQFGFGVKSSYTLLKKIIFEINCQFRNINEGPLHTVFFNTAFDSGKKISVPLHDYSATKMYPIVSLTLKYKLHEK